MPPASNKKQNVKLDLQRGLQKTASVASGLSVYDNVSLGGDSSSSNTAHGKAVLKARQLMKVKHRLDNAALRKILFKPKVYESWKDGDLNEEIAERDRLLRDIAEKEKRLLRRRTAASDGDHASDSSDDDQQVIKALEKLKTQKQREDEYKIKTEAIKRRLDEEASAALEEKLESELHNPSVYVRHLHINNKN